MINDNNTPDPEETGAENGQKAPSEEAGSEQDIAGEAEALSEADFISGQTYEELQAENAGLKDRMLRTMADMENLRRRTEREKQNAQKFGIRKFAEDLLSVADNLKRALAAVPEEVRLSAEDTFESLLTGVEMTDKQLHDIFDRHAIKLIQPANEKFDPNLHHAIAEIPGTELPQGTVIDVVQTGYLIDDRLLRPAMVTVAKGDHPAKQVDPKAAAPDSESNQ